MHDDWTFISLVTKVGSPTLYSCGLKSINYSYNIYTYFPIIASNGKPGLNERVYQCEISICRGPRGHTKGTEHARMLHHRAHNQKEQALH